MFLIGCLCGFCATILIEMAFLIVVVAMVDKNKKL